MKKEKAKAKTASESKKLKEAFTKKLINAFTAVVADYGKAKKTKAVIEKFAKRLSKKVDLKAKAVLQVETSEVVADKAAPVKNAKAVKKTTAGK